MNVLRQSDSIKTRFDQLCRAFLAGVFGIGLVVASTAIAHGEIRIGVSVPLSGTFKGFGEQFLAGANKAVEDINRTRADAEKLQIVAIDDHCDIKFVHLAADDLISADIAIATGFLCNIVAETAAARLSGEAIPILIGGARSMRLTRDRDREDWITFRFVPNDNSQAEANFAILKSRWLNKPFAIIDDGTMYSRRLSDEFRARMEEYGLPPQFIDTYRPAQSTQAGLIRRLQNSGVAAAFIGGTVDDIAIIARDMMDFGPDMELIAGEPVTSLRWLEDRESVPAGLLAIMPERPEYLEPAQHLVEALSTSPQDPPQLYVFNGYAAIEIINQALQLGATQLTNAMAGGNFATVLGNISFDETGENARNPFILQRWDGSRFVPIDAPAKPASQ